MFNLLTTYMQAFEANGVRPSYASGHSFENALRGVKRRCTMSSSLQFQCSLTAISLVDSRHASLVSQDSIIETHRKKLQAASDKVAKTQSALRAGQVALSHIDPAMRTPHRAAVQGLEGLKTAHAKATEAHKKLVESGKQLAKGTGQYETV
jgi:hypothetical protein